MDTTLPNSERTVSIDGPRLPAVIVFDVNQTLSDMSPIASRFVDIGAPAHLAATWFAALLRDGFALTAAGSSAPFAIASASAHFVRVSAACPSTTPSTRRSNTSWEASRSCPCTPTSSMAYPWDIDGAYRAGLATGWINRTGATYPDYFTAPTFEATSVRHLAINLSQ